MTSEKVNEYVSSMQKQQYRFFGANNHSAAKLCLWLKKSLRGQGSCYKQKFYGIQSHRCLQMTPNIYCVQQCVFCWRAWEHAPTNAIPEKWDEPEQLVQASVEAQRKLISGFGGFEKTDKAKFREAQNPNQVAISLNGEPTMYPHLGNLIETYHKNGFTTFLVTNGLFPEVLEHLDPLPTQLYVSLVAPDEATHKKINGPLLSDSWKRLNKTLELLPSLNTRKVIRMTAVKDWNVSDPAGYAKLIKKSSTDFVETKSYMCVGHSRERGLTLANMLTHEETRNFALQVNERLGYELVDEQPASRVVLLSSGAKPQKIPGI